jgi:hypothetical protein
VPDLALEARLSRTSSDDGDGIVWLFGVVFLLAYIPGGCRVLADVWCAIGLQSRLAVLVRGLPCPAAGALVIETVLWTVIWSVACLVADKNRSTVRGDAWLLAYTGDSHVSYWWRRTIRRRSVRKAAPRRSAILRPELRAVARVGVLFTLALTHLDVAERV